MKVKRRLITQVSGKSETHLGNIKMWNVPLFAD